MDSNDLWQINQQKIIAEKLTNNPEWIEQSSWEEFILAMNLKNPQSYGAIIQNRIIKELNGTKIPPTYEKGDCLINSYYHEIKSSILTHTNDMMNLVQIRPWQKIKGYYCFAFDIREHKHFNILQYYLSHEQMIEELEIKSELSHGTKRLAKQNIHNEKSIRIKIQPYDENYKRWQKKYLSHILEK
jgi:hypothetical protein